MAPPSRTPPAHAYDVEDGYRRKLKESDPHRLEQRQKAIDKGKNTRAYAHYIEKVPKAIRPVGTSEDEKRYPRTPDKYEIVSKRGWEGKVRAWRLRLHQYNPEPKPGEEVIRVPTQIPRDQRLGLVKDSGTQQGKKREREAEGSDPASKRTSYGPGGAAPSLSPIKALTAQTTPTKAIPDSVPEEQEEKGGDRKKVSIFDEWSDGEVDDIGL